MNVSMTQSVIAGTWEGGEHNSLILHIRYLQEQIQIYFTHQTQEGQGGTQVHYGWYNGKFSSLQEPKHTTNKELNTTCDVKELIPISRIKSASRSQKQWLQSESHMLWSVFVFPVHRISCSILQTWSERFINFFNQQSSSSSFVQRVYSNKSRSTWSCNLGIHCWQGFCCPACGRCTWGNTSLPTSPGHSSSQWGSQECLPLKHPERPVQDWTYRLNESNRNSPAHLHSHFLKVLSSLRHHVFEAEYGAVWVSGTVELTRLQVRGVNMRPYVSPEEKRPTPGRKTAGLQYDVSFTYRGLLTCKSWTFGMWCWFLLTP